MSKGRKTANREELAKIIKDELLTQTFPTVEEWVKNWIRTYLHDTPAHRKLFLCNGSYMDIGEMLRNADPVYSNPCVIYETDVHSVLSGDATKEYRNITFHVCVRASDQLAGDIVEVAKEHALHIMNEFRKFVIQCRQRQHPNAKTVTEVGNVQSGMPFLDGWQSVSITLQYCKLFCPLPNWNEYV